MQGNHFADGQTLSAIGSLQKSRILEKSGCFGREPDQHAFGQQFGRDVQKEKRSATKKSNY